MGRMVSMLLCSTRSDLFPTRMRGTLDTQEHIWGTKKKVFQRAHITGSRFFRVLCINSWVSGMPAHPSSVKLNKQVNLLRDVPNSQNVYNWVHISKIQIEYNCPTNNGANLKSVHHIYRVYSRVWRPLMVTMVTKGHLNKNECFPFTLFSVVKNWIASSRELLPNTVQYFQLHEQSIWKKNSRYDAVQF